MALERSSYLSSPNLDYIYKGSGPEYEPEVESKETNICIVCVCDIGIHVLTHA